MSNQNKPQQAVSVKTLFSRNDIQRRFEELLGKKAQGFMSSVIQIVGNNRLLSKSDSVTVLNAAATAASLDLPINQSLGFAWIVPYKGHAQFQLGWKGFVQLAQRTGQYHRINVVNVYENQFKGYNALTEDLDADFSAVGSGEVVGYAAYFRLVNGFEKLVYWDKEKVLAHAKKYSKSFGSSNSPWSDEDQFDAMAKKTVLKNTLSKWGIMSIEIQTAVIADQSVQSKEGQYQYIDNQSGLDIQAVDEEKEAQRIKEHIDNAETLEELAQVHGLVSQYNLADEYGEKAEELKNAKSSN